MITLEDRRRNITSRGLIKEEGVFESEGPVELQVAGVAVRHVLGAKDASMVG